MVDNSMHGQKMNVESMQTDQSLTDLCGEMPRARDASFGAITKPFHRGFLTGFEPAALAA